MARTKKEKKVILDQYSDLVKKAKGFVVLKPTKVTPNEANSFRRDLFDFGSKFSYVKNTIFKIALKENNLPEISSLEAGENAVVFFEDDIVGPSKSLKTFIESAKTKDKENKIVIIAGVLDGQLLDANQVIELAEMPTIQGSVGMILGILDMAMSSVVNVLEDAPRAYVSILDQKFGDQN